jgi:hypothetical protein
MPTARGPTMLAPEPIARRPPCRLLSRTGVPAVLDEPFFLSLGRGVLPTRSRRFAGGRLQLDVVASLLDTSLLRPCPPSTPARH